MNIHSMNFDLHSHSTASDGSLSPTTLVNTAADAGIEVLALTDHDTTAGLGEAGKTARGRGIRLINGVEISVRWQKHTLHVVGLAIDPECNCLNLGLDKMHKVRDERARKIAARLRKQGLENAYDRAHRLAEGAEISRTHFARLLVEDGLCKDMKQAFKRYLGMGKPAHVTAQWAELDEAINWIHTAGGVAVLAHPMLYSMTAAWRRRMLKAFKETGGDALEVCCGGSNAGQVQLSARHALDYDLLGSVGSDFHSHEQRWIHLGQLPPLPSSLKPVWTAPSIVRQLQ